MASGTSVRPAHPAGPTFLAYTPNGRKLITVGSNDTIRIFDTASSGEPRNIDDGSDSNTAVVASNDFFITGSEDGSVRKFSLATNAFDQVLVRSTLPIRGLALSPDRRWVAVASDELAVKIVSIDDMTQVRYLREQTKSAKHVSFDPSGQLMTVSCTDGVIYVYNLEDTEPTLVKKVDGIVRALESDDQASSEVVWHPDGRAFVAPNATREAQVISKRDWERQRVFANAHTGDLTALAWSPNGALLATASTDRTVRVWDTKTQRILNTMRSGVALSIAWHPSDNILAYTTSEGELHIDRALTESAHLPLLEKDLQPAPFIHDPLADVFGNANGAAVLTRDESEVPMRKARRGTPDSLDDILGPQSDDDGFLEDDDRAGYAEGQLNNHGKRTNGHLDGEQPLTKRRAYSAWQPQIHESFQPGSTPWRGNRRYLCLNLIGVVWTVDQDTHHTITVEFYDRDFQREFHFTDPFSYDKACLSEKGTLFSCQPSKDNKQPAMIYYRPHETWTTRADWRTSLPAGETILAITLSDSYVVVTTSANYVRVYTLFGTPLSVHREKSTPAVTCASWRDYVMTIGNGPIGGDGAARLIYSIENIRREETCQSEDIVALPEGAQLRNVFFSDTGDPYIYDSTGTLLVLLHWRTPGQAKWHPVLDTRCLDRLASGRRDESYWPVAVANGRFYCIILKGGDRHPYFPRPLLADFEFQVPLTTPAATSALSKKQNGDASEQGLTETQRLEASYVLTSLSLSLAIDLAASTTSTAAHRAEIARQTLEADKTLLQLLAAECVEGEERGMKALEIVRLLRDGSGRMMEAAGKVASRFGREVLRERIAELAERRAAGEGDDGEE